MPPSPELDDQYSLAYEELRRLAATVLSGEPHASLSPTTLVHEVWLKLQGGRGVTAESELHFKRIAARAMRQVLIDAARRRRTTKHGAGLSIVAFDESIDAPVSTPDELLALDGALDELARAYPRQAEMIESRYFAGLSVPETAELLGVSIATVNRDWRVARAWLAAELRRAG
ncbi:MAG: ECF-type sigma factor [Gemmatimonadales bacterium]